MHVVVNAAESVDGKLAPRTREQLRVSGEADFARVDRLRAAVDAVLVGVGTVLADDPSLTVDDPSMVGDRRDRGDPPQPARVVADSRARTPPGATVLDDAAETYVLVSEATPIEHRDSLLDAGAEIVEAGEERVDLRAALDALADEGVERIMAEGGGELIFSLFEADLVDELRVYVGSIVVGGRDAPTLVDGEGFTEGYPRLSLESVERLDEGVLLEYVVPSE